MGAARARPVVLIAVSVHLLLARGFAALQVAGTAPPLRALEWPGELVLALAHALPGCSGCSPSPAVQPPCWPPAC